jgi:hypothetical protein
MIKATFKRCTIPTASLVTLDLLSSIFRKDGIVMPFSKQLDVSDRWVLLATKIPWNELESIYKYPFFLLPELRLFRFPGNTKNHFYRHPGGVLSP